MATVNLDKISIVHWCPDTEKHSCGYCKNSNCSISHGMWAEQLTVEDYQNLIDRGWRRSGKYCYKPIMQETCCPSYTIRCETLKFHPSKSQKKIIKRLNKYIIDGDKPEIRDNVSTSSNSGITNESNVEFVDRQNPLHELDFSKFKDNTVLLDESVTRASGSRLEQGKIVTDEKQCDQNETVNISESIPKKIKSGGFKEGMGADPNRPPCKKAKLLRLERKQQKILGKGIEENKALSRNQQKTLEEFLAEIPENAKHKLKIELISTSSPGEDWNKSVKVEFELYKRYQMIIHNDPPEKCKMEGFLRFLVNTPLKLQLEMISNTHPHFNKEAALFEKYQMAVHNDEPEDCDQKQFYEFLVDSPLKSLKVRGINGTVTYGSYHQQYWIDDKLIAVGVIDILPKCVSSVYFFYDPDYRFLTLGTYGSLREISFVRSLHIKEPSIEYFYMGYYIHTCPKMRYKGQLSNSLLLCPETYKWFPIENCIPKLNANKYARLNDNIDEIDENICSTSDIDRMKILVNYTLTVFAKYKILFGELDIYQTIGPLIGKKCSDRMVFVSSKGYR